MSKKIKILIALTILTLFLGVYLSIDSRPEKKSDNEKSGKVDTELLKKKYKEEASVIVSDFSSVLKEGDLKSEKIKGIKERLLALKLPPEFKDMHLKLVVSASKIENASGEDAKKEAFESLKEIDKLKTDYTWLN